MRRRAALAAAVAVAAAVVATVLEALGLRSVLVVLVVTGVAGALAWLVLVNRPATVVRRLENLDARHLAGMEALRREMQDLLDEVRRRDGRG